MMEKIDPMIEKLVADVAPVRPQSPVRSFLAWAAVTVSATFLLMIFSSLRPDLMEQMHARLFLGEITALFLSIVSLAVSAVWLCFPDLRQKPWVIYLPALPLAVYGGLMIFRATHPEMTHILPEDAHNDMNCAFCITMYSLVPGFWMFRTLRQHATTHPRLAGAISLVTAASIGVLVLKFLEGNDSIGHLIAWHLTPVALIGILGALLGQRWLRW